jgi:HPt (histidine-containing phosphotransfer) domain-containing protein
VTEQVESVEAAYAASDAGGLHAAALQLLDAAETIGASALIDVLRPLSDAAAAGSLAGMEEMVTLVRTEVDSTVAFWGHIETEE